MPIKYGGAGIKIYALMAFVLYPFAKVVWAKYIQGIKNLLLGDGEIFI